MVYHAFMEGRVSTAWLILSGGILDILVADIPFNLATCHSAHNYLVTSNFIYVVGYGLLALGFIRHSIEL